jgi:uncharacterized protein
VFEIRVPDYAQAIASQLGLTTAQVRAALRLLDEGNTIPFIARYRKEATGELDEAQLRDIAGQYEAQKNLYQRKCDVLRLVSEQGAITDRDEQARFAAAVQAARTVTEVDDLYRPYRPKRKTRASVAKERGLEPLAKWLTMPDRVHDTAETVLQYAAQFVADDKGVYSAEEALQGACDILAEHISDDPQARKWLRAYTMEHGSIRSSAVDPNAQSVYEMYYDYLEPLKKVVPHRILAMNRGEREEFLKVSIEVPMEPVLDYLFERLAPASIVQSSAETYVGRILRETVADAYRRLLFPAIEREIRTELTNRAGEHAIAIFGENLRHLLMQPPIRGKVVLGVDPAYRTGCKLAVVDDTGKLLATSVIYPTPPQNRVEAAREELFRLLTQYDVDVIAIGNGTASRETEAFVAESVKLYREQANKTVPYVIVSEAGASVYSASELAREEFPELDVSERSAISIARRLQDPLAELVKIDPKSIGVGQYQHDVSQKKLGERLAAVVESVVNQVGVDVNTASPSLLSYVAGLTRTVARNIVEYRNKNGRFRNRKELANVPRMGPKTLEQCVGFLRIADGDEVLDQTPIHPESYDAVYRLLDRIGGPKEFIAHPEQRAEYIRLLRSEPLESLASEIGVGVPTLRDILDALERPGRDPREDVPPPILRTDVLSLEDVEVGMVLTGTVRNVVDFGAFVDVGVKVDGLVHISQLSDRFVKHPLDVVAVGDIVKVRVIQIDRDKQRLGLSMKGL